MVNDYTIRFEGDENYHWNFINGHFVKVDSPTKILSPEEQERMLLGYVCVDFDSSDWMIDTTTVTKYDTTAIVDKYAKSMKVMALEYVDFMTDSSSPTISQIKSKTKKSMFKSDIISF